MIGRTTICCSAIVLTTAYGTTRALQPAAAGPLFPAETAWSAPLSGTLSAAPAFAERRGYLPLDGTRVDAYDLTDGNRIWTFPASGPGRPAAGDRLVFIVQADALVAVRDTDGSVAWRQPLAEPLSAPIVWDNGWLMTVSKEGTVGARRGTDGALLWERSLDAPASAAPALAADRVYVPTVDDRIVALHVGTGEPLWARTLGGTPHAVIARDDRVYVGSIDNVLYCLRARTGQIDWRWRTGGDIVGLPHVDDDRIYFTSLDNILRGLDRRSGGQRWLRPLPLRPTGGPVRAADSLIVSGLSPALRAYAAGNGTARGAMDAPGDLAAPPHVIEEDGQVTIVVLTRDVTRGTVMTALRPRAAPP